MKKLISISILLFLCLCGFAFYQAGSLDLSRVTQLIQPQPQTTEPVGEVDATEIDTSVVDQVAVTVFAEQAGDGAAQTSTVSSAVVDSDRIFSSAELGLTSGMIGSSAVGRVVPQVEALLSMMQSGNVIQIYVEEGDFVALGDVLLQLDDSLQKAAVAEDTAELNQAKAELARITSPARAEEIAAAEAALEGANARLRRLDESTLPGQLAVAEASLSAAQAGRDKVTEAPNVAVVQAANAELEGASLYLAQAQRAYDQVSWRNDVGLLPESQNLQDATVQYNAALAKVRAAQTGATQAEISGASANVQRAEAELSMLQSALPAERSALEADVKIYTSRLALLSAGPLQADIDAATARIQAAEARLASSTAALTNTALRAPFSGTVAMIEPSIGERIEIGDSVIRLADLTSWQIETSDLSELDLGNLTLGSRTAIQFDAIPDLVLDGYVKSVRPFGEDAEGETYYRAIILPEEPDNRLRWNMTAFVTFESQQQQ